MAQITEEFQADVLSRAAAIARNLAAPGISARYVSLAAAEIFVDARSRRHAQQLTLGGIITGAGSSAVLTAFTVEERGAIFGGVGGVLIVAGATLLGLVRGRQPKPRV